MAKRDPVPGSPSRHYERQSPNRRRRDELVGRRDVPTGAHRPSTRGRPRRGRGTAGSHPRVRRPLGRPRRLRHARCAARRGAARRARRPRPKPASLRLRDGRDRTRPPRPLREAAGDDVRGGAAADGRGRGCEARHDVSFHVPLYAGLALAEGTCR